VAPIVLDDVVFDGVVEGIFSLFLNLEEVLELTLNNVILSDTQTAIFAWKLPYQEGHLRVFLGGNVSFIGNRDSAIYLSKLTNVTFLATGPTMLSFVNNTGTKGAGLSIDGPASFYGPQMDILFDGNVCDQTGSAIIGLGILNFDVASFKVLNSHSRTDDYLVVGAVDISGPSFFRVASDIIFDTVNTACIISRVATVSVIAGGTLRFSNCQGGGLYQRSGSVQLQASHITFLNNTRLNHYGGAIHAHYFDSLILSAETIEFENNTASYGGAISLLPYGKGGLLGDPPVSAVVFNSTQSLLFRGNHAIPGSWTLDGMLFWERGHGGAIQLGTSDPLPLGPFDMQWPETGSIIFDRNSAFTLGGAIFTRNLTIIRQLYNRADVYFSNNVAQYGCVTAGRNEVDDLPLDLDSVPLALFSNNSILPPVGDWAIQFWLKPIYRTAIEEYQCIDISQIATSCPPQPSFGIASSWQLGPRCSWNYFAYDMPLLVPPLATLNSTINVYGNVEGVEKTSRLRLSSLGDGGLTTVAVHGNLSVALSLKIWTSYDQATSLANATSSSSFDVLQLRHQSSSHHPVFSTMIYDNANYMLDGLFGLESIDIGGLLVYLYSFGDLSVDKAVILPPSPIPSMPPSSTPSSTNWTKLGLYLSISANVALLFLVLIGVVCIVRWRRVCCFAASSQKQGFDAYVQTDDEHYSRYEPNAPLLNRGL
jgi:predicted outer membrane repeat protein